MHRHQSKAGLLIYDDSRHAGTTRRYQTRQCVITAAAAAAADMGAAMQPSQQRPDFQKIFILGIMFFCCTFNYTLLQNMKDSIVVTSAGAEVLPFLGAYGVLPTSLLFFIYYDKLTKRMPEKMVYYLALAPFLLFYCLFATVMYPAAPALHPVHLLESWRAMLPAGLVGLAGMGVYYLYSIFYIFAELWGGVAISVLFWGLADDVFTLHEARNIYPGLGIIANIGLVLAGFWVKMVNQVAGGSDVTAVRLLLATVVANSGILFALKHFVDKRYLTAASGAGAAAAAAAQPSPGACAEASSSSSSQGSKKKKKKKASKGSLSTAWGVLKDSTKVGNLAVLVVAYFVVEKLFDFAWKAQLLVFYPSTAQYQAVLADVSQLIGVTTIVLMMASKFVFQYLGWAGAALSTPVMILITGALFFACALVSHTPGLVAPGLASLIIPLGAAAGVAGRVISKSAKYSLFDPAKEMVYITMNKQEKQEGKAAVDLLGSYFGKSGAAWITQGLVLVAGTLTDAMPLIAAIHVMVCMAWTRSTLSLARLMPQGDVLENASSIADPDTVTDTKGIAVTAVALEARHAAVGGTAQAGQQLPSSKDILHEAQEVLRAFGVALTSKKPRRQPQPTGPSIRVAVEPKLLLHPKPGNGVQPASHHHDKGSTPGHIATSLAATEALQPAAELPPVPPSTIPPIPSAAPDLEASTPTPRHGDLSNQAGISATAHSSVGSSGGSHNQS